jgi:hypothetical protein
MADKPELPASMAVLAAKVVVLEHALRWLMKERYLRSNDPIGQATRAAEELKEFFNPDSTDSPGVLYLQQAVDSLYDVLLADLEKDLGTPDSGPPP